MQEFLQSPIPMLIAIFAIMYFLLLRPQQQRAKQHKELVDNVRRGDTVVTAGGVIGRVVKVPQKDDPEITVEIADGVQVRVLRSTLSEVRAKGQPVEPKAEKKA
jgi:preprotein translocase subunit YajC